MNRITWAPSNDQNIASYDVETAGSLLDTWSLVANIAHDLGGANYDTNTGSFFVDHDGTAEAWYRVTAIDAEGLRSAPTTPFQCLGQGAPTLATLADLKAYLTISDTDNDALLTRLLLAASQWFEQQTGRKLALATYTETLNGNRGRMIIPRRYPVQSVTSVTVGEKTVPQAVATTDNGWILQDGAIYLRGYRLPEGFANVSLTYTAGFPVIPQDVQQAVIEVAAGRFKYMKRLGGETSASIGGESVSYAPQTVPVSIQTVIDTYRRV